MRDFEGKIAVIAGVGPGLGRAVASRLAEEGASLVLASRSDFASELADDLAVSAPARVIGSRVDLSSPESCRTLVSDTIAAFGGVDLLACTGRAIDTFDLFADADLEAWRTIMETNLFGPLELAKHCLPTMRDRGGGAIVLVSSLITRTYKPRQGGYAISKAALMMAAQVLATEVGSDRIRVNTVVPGWMAGRSTDSYLRLLASRSGRSLQEETDAVTARIPLGTIPGDTEVADAVTYLLSSRASAITGQAIDVNGGEYLG